MMIASIRKNIPAGKFRVIGCDLFDHSDYIKKDCDTKEEALKIADAHNRQRSGSMDDVYYVYDDKGNYLHGEEAIKNSKGETAVGVTP
jgi:hypothetical protein